MMVVIGIILCLLSLVCAMLLGFAICEWGETADLQKKRNIESWALAMFAASFFFQAAGLFLVRG